MAESRRDGWRWAGRQARLTRDPRAWAANALFPGRQGGLGQRRSLLLWEKLVEGETSPLWLSEPLSHLLSHGEGLAAAASGVFILIEKEECVCVHLCGEVGVFMCPSVH